MAADEKAARILRAAWKRSDPIFPIELWSGERIGPDDRTASASGSPTRRCCAKSSFGPASPRSARLWATGRIDVFGGTLFDLVEKGSRGNSRRSSGHCRNGGCCATFPAVLLSGRASAPAARAPRGPRPLRLRLGQGSDRPPLRRLQRLLPPLPRRADGLQLRLFHRLVERHRPGPARQARPHMPQAETEAGRTVPRHRLRLGRAADPRRGELRRHRHRRLALRGADGTRQASACARRGSRTG